MQERGTAPALNDEGRSRPANKRHLLLAGLVAAAVVLVDQLTKTWAVHRLSHGPIHVVWKLDLQLGYNSGASFGLARGWAPVIAGVALAAVVVLVAAVRHVASALLALFLGLVIGGAVGNLSDRIFRGHHGSVVDFIALHFWPTFNVADACVVVGAVGAALLLVRPEAPHR
jgi:signal peptidase II